MKKYTFRLEQVRRVRRMQEESAKAALQSANAEVQRCVAAVEESVTDYQRVTEFTSRSSAVADFMQRRYFNELAGQAVIAARQAQAAAEAQAEIQRQSWSEAAKKVKVLDRLDDRRREDYAIEFDRETQAEMDDITNGRFGRTESGVL